MLGGPDSFADGKYDRTPVGELLPVYLNRSRQSPGPARPGRATRLSPGAHPRRLAPALGPDAEDRGRRAAAAGGDGELPDAQPGRQHQAGGRGPLGGARPRRQDRPGAGGAAVRQGARRGALDRRPLALGHPPRRPGGERPRSLVAADRPLARRRRPGPGRSRRAAQGRARHGARPPSSSPSASATPSTGRSTTPRLPSRSPCRAETT